jgi:electron transfer flavoprotein alpha subunit
MGNVLIVAEQAEGKLRSATLNALTFGKKSLEASAGGDLIILVLGANVASAAQEAAKYGAKKVIVIEDSALKHYLAETYAPLVVQIAKAVKAEVVAATATAYGKDLLPRVAALLEAGMASDIWAVAGAKQFKRPMIAGNIIGTVEIKTPIAVVTVRQTEFDAAQPSGESPVEAASAGTINALSAEVIKVDLVKSARPDLSEAKVVVSGGRGLKSADNFKQLETLTDLLGGALGATRAACDAGMVPNDLQVGQTGKIVAPDLYIAIGVSGALQHLAGMKSSKVIVAINKDEEAPIFQVADYGLVAKWEDTLPTLIEQVKALKAGS